VGRTETFAVTSHVRIAIEEERNHSKVEISPVKIRGASPQKITGVASLLL